MYFCAGGKPTVDTEILSGNFLQDISDHLANYTIICNTKSPVVIERPFVRIFSERNKQKFTNYLENSNFSEVLSENDTNEAYNRFHTIMQSAFEHSFPLTRLSHNKSLRCSHKLFSIWQPTAILNLQIFTLCHMTIFRTIICDMWPWVCLAGCVQGHGQRLTTEICRGDCRRRQLGLLYACKCER